MFCFRKREFNENSNAPNHCFLVGLQPGGGGGDRSLWRIMTPNTGLVLGGVTIGGSSSTSTSLGPASAIATLLLGDIEDGKSRCCLTGGLRSATRIASLRDLL